MAAWVAAAGMALVGVGIVWEGVKGLRPPPPGKKPATSPGTAYACLAIGGVIMVGAAVMPFVLF